MGDIAVRLAQPDDAGAIAAIHVASWQATYRGSVPDSYLDSLTIDQRLPMWKQILTAPSSLVRVWVAESGDGIVGFCSIGPAQSSTGEHNGDTFELYTIYLRPDRERQGIGRVLLQHAERGMSEMGATSAVLWVATENDPARRFYEASSWEPDGTEKVDELWGQTVREVRYSKRLVPDER